MWFLGAFVGIALLLQAAWIATILWAPHTPPDATATDRSQAPARRPFLAVGILLALVGSGVAFWAGYLDMFEAQYKLASLVLAPAALGIGGLAQISALLAVPRPHRRSGAEVVAILLGLMTLGIGSCYGLTGVGW